MAHNGRLIPIIPPTGFFTMSAFRPYFTPHLIRICFAYKDTRRKLFHFNLPQCTIRFIR